MDNLTLKVIARIYTDFGEKFGVPRQKRPGAGTDREDCI